MSKEDTEIDFFRRFFLTEAQRHGELFFCSSLKWTVRHSTLANRELGFAIENENDYAARPGTKKLTTDQFALSINVFEDRSQLFCDC